MTKGFQARTTEYMWGVVATAEPKDVRTIRGYITILEYETEEGAPLSHRVMFSDPKGIPFQSLTVEDLDVFYSATQAALAERELRAVDTVILRLPAGDIIR